MPIYRSRVLVCNGTGCTSNHGVKVVEKLKAEIEQHKLSEEIQVVPTGCHGMCEMGPLMVVYPEGILYCRVRPDDVQNLVEEHMMKGRPVEPLMYKGQDTKSIPHYKDIPFYGKQHRITLQNCGYINPGDIEEYIGKNGYEGLRKALSTTPQAVIEEVKKSGLRGR